MQHITWGYGVLAAFRIALMWPQDFCCI